MNYLQRIKAYLEVRAINESEWIGDGCMGIKILDVIGTAKGSVEIPMEETKKNLPEVGPHAEMAHMGYYYDEMAQINRCFKCSADESAVDLAVQAAKEALEGNQLAMSEIDLFIFVSQTPEYTLPTTARVILEKLGGNDNLLSFDMNTNCTGLPTAVDIASKMMKSSRLKRALLVHADSLNKRVEGQLTYFTGILSDTACAVILEQTAEASDIVDSYYASTDRTLFGMTDGIYHRDGLKSNSEVGSDIELGSAGIKKVLARNGLKVESISCFCFSQMLMYNIKKMSEQIGIDSSDVLFVSKEIGYMTGGSPFWALKEAIRVGKVKRGDYFVVWTVGVGTQHIVELIKY